MVLFFFGRAVLIQKIVFACFFAHFQGVWAYWCWLLLLSIKLDENGEESGLPWLIKSRLNWSLVKDTSESSTMVLNLLVPNLFSVIVFKFDTDFDRRRIPDDGNLLKILPAGLLLVNLSGVFDLLSLAVLLGFSVTLPTLALPTLSLGLKFSFSLWALLGFIFGALNPNPDLCEIFFDDTGNATLDELICFPGVNRLTGVDWGVCFCFEGVLALAEDTGGLRELLDRVELAVDRVLVLLATELCKLGFSGFVLFALFWITRLAPRFLTLLVLTPNLDSCMSWWFFSIFLASRSAYFSASWSSCNVNRNSSTLE